MRRSMEYGAAPRLLLTGTSKRDYYRNDRELADLEMDVSQRVKTTLGSHGACP